MESLVESLIAVAANLVSEQYERYESLKNARLVLHFVRAVERKVKLARDKKIDLPEEILTALNEEVRRTTALFERIDKNEALCGPFNIAGKYRRRLVFANKLHEQELRFRKCIDELKKIRELEELAPDKPISPADILVGEALEFWDDLEKNAGEMISIASLWEKYEALFQEENGLDAKAKRVVEKWLKVSQESIFVSAYSFQSAVVEFGFPFCPSREALRLREADLKVNEKLEMANQLNGLIKDWETIGQAVYLKLKRPLEEATKDVKEETRNQEMARVIDQWYQDINRTGVHREKDCVRSSWSNFFVRFSVFWQLSEFSHDIFGSFDFPGKWRVISFIEIGELMDEANYRICIKKLGSPQKDGRHRTQAWEKAAVSWKSARPRVYTFLRAWLEQKRVPSNLIPKPVCFGGHREDWVLPW